MSAVQTMMISLTLYKVVTIFAGLTFAYMGYRLFISGIFSDAGELRTNWENKHLVLRKAAPGTFFAVLGAIVTCVSLWRGLNFEPLPQDGSSGGSGGGSGMFEMSTNARRAPSSTVTNESRDVVIKDIGYLNGFSTELFNRRKDDASPGVTVGVQDSDRIIDLIDRAKAALILSVWSPDWGDPDDFREWAGNTGRYPVSEPPPGIAQAVAIYKGEAR